MLRTCQKKNGDNGTLKQFPTLNGGDDQCRQRLVDCLRPVAASLLQARLLGARLLQVRLVTRLRQPLSRNGNR